MIIARHSGWIKNILVLTLLLTLALSVTSGVVYSQSRSGRWAFGIRGAANVWIDDYDKRTVTPGGELFIRYGLTRYVSLGFKAGYDEFISKQDPPILFPYLKLQSFPVSLAVWFHFLHGEKFCPYVYVGGGALVYQRKDANGNSVPDGKLRSAVSVPLGLGLEYISSRRLAFALDLGFRFADDNIDFIPSKTPDGFATAALGVNLYFGRSDDDDDDGDGLTNGEERKYGTNPDKYDTDGDGLSDGEEVLKYHTNPLKADTDGDGLSDGDEVLKYHTDPLNPDTDGDGLSDGDEVLKYHTDPLKADTDGDGLSDGDEVLKYHTDPLKADTDGDGLSDGDEVLKYHTNPLNPDTDGGSVNDSIEVARGTDPLNPNDDVIKVPEVGKKIVLEGVNFRTGRAELTPESAVILDQAFLTLKENPEIEVEIGGHTDTKGTRSTNRKLSLARANSVKTFLVNRGIVASRIRTKGYGPDKPIASNKTEQGRAKNRRIEFARTK